MMRRPKALLKRLARAQLRLKVMAGVVVVTLVALVAFDVAAITVMRGYLLTQTDEDLQYALKMTQIQLPRLVPGFPQKAVFTRVGKQVMSGQSVVAPQVQATGVRAVPSVTGEFAITFLPLNGKGVTLQTAAVPGMRLPVGIAAIAAQPGAHTVLSPGGGGALMRLESVRVGGGHLVAGASLDQVTTTIRQVEIIVILGSVAIVLLIGAGVFLVLRRGLRPIEAMAAQADRITAGDLTERVRTHGTRSEVGRLGAALNGMLARIEADVHEREKGQEQMRRFFADASHELRTPLASLRAHAELYQQGAVTGTDDMDEVMCRIALETRRMGRLVDDMLRLARLGQRPSQCREPVDVTALVGACAARVRIADPARTWEQSAAAGLATVGDEELLRRAVDNLLTNVLVHTPPETTGTITAASDGENITIEVRDDGPGVAPDTLPHIFERFYRAGARQRPGSGLGLAIVAEIAAAHGGTALAASVTPHGLVVTLTVPDATKMRDYSERTVAALSG